jgi:hypothetical protein
VNLLSGAGSGLVAAAVCEHTFSGLDAEWLELVAATCTFVKETRMPRFVLMLFFALTLSAQQVVPSPAVSAFKKMMSLKGEWEGKDADGNPVRSSFQPVVSGTTLLETLTPTGMDEMLSLYSVDGDGIQLAHYCPSNNQPRMRAVSSGADSKELDFKFTGAGNLPDISVGHQHRLVLQFDDADHITETWTWRHGNHDMPMVFHLTRKR